MVESVAALPDQVSLPGRRPPAQRRPDDERMAAEVTDAVGLLHLANRRGLRVPDDVVATVFAAREAQQRETPVDAVARTRFWHAYSVLQAMLGPAVRARRWHRCWFYVTLAVLLVVQCYFTVGAVTRDQIKRLDQELFALQGQLTAVEGNARLAGDLQAQAAQRSGSVRSIRDQLKVRGADRDAYQALAGRLMFFLPAAVADGTGSENPADREAAQAIARSLRLTTLSLTLDFLAKYVLPALYGLLGACAFVLRQLSDELGRLRFAHERRVQYELRLHVGLLSGLAIGWFITPGDSGSMAANLSPLALAFVAGYGSDLLFALLDRIVGALVAPRADSDAGAVAERVREARAETRVADHKAAA